MKWEDLKKGDCYRFTKEVLEKHPWLARGVYTHCGDHSTYSPSIDDIFIGELVVYYGEDGHTDFEVELVD